MKKLIEAALFISGRQLSLSELSSTLGVSPKEIKQGIEELKKDYSKRNTPLKIVEINGSYKIDLQPEYLEKVKQFAPQMDMSRALITTLSYVAYKQPVTQSELVKKFGNRIYEYVSELVKRGLIRAEPYRHTKRLSTTKKLLSYLGNEDLEKIKKAIEAAKLERKERAEFEKSQFSRVFKTRRRKKLEREVLEKELSPEDWAERIKQEKEKRRQEVLDIFDKAKRAKKKQDFEDDLDIITGKNE